MTYSTLLVHLDGARPNTTLLDVTATLAARFDAKVIGVAACQPVQIGSCDGYMDGALAVAVRDIVTEELAHAKTEFHAHPGLQPHILDWRSIPTLDTVAHAVAMLARCVDLLVTSVGPTPGDPTTHADTGDLVLNAGRPVLVVPETRATADFRNVVVGWTDTRECRRAIVDALPFLHHAERVTLVEASYDPVEARRGIDDITAWLDRHGIGADRINTRVKGSPTSTLQAIADDVEADLIVAGAYGHSRIREWAFGGVTRDLLLHDHRCTLLSH
ncbi:MAG TPA: universal stress protein [Sphingomonas sp.]|nr:universal stress protein [Sphingomonas sp.]